ncbi:DC-STAMP domain containing 1 [Homo sapiens]|uniref:Isoform 3 of E3 ubiquitin-protein ligase DCST1 n=1 Tax=Homo sapiens TaxID=9606 RepID=Q5T197-3|nr:E3 ubiquitin-protein ligase DCST1 isoform 2 [Homo sapiens]KAI2519421.1 DC-STAMP domain containing 1 [Homo sapiens]KAI4082948.1 DC-STAMP domain containing 1 [Homo sapiens]|eukprot:NP_001137159.1 E3 ubiquitin-protein ligase DCST1 isoform 2 [Homo sapiens]
MDIKHHQNGTRGQRRKQPHTTVQRLLTWGLPVSCSWFLWRQPGEFPVTALLLGAGAGGLLAIGLGAMGWGTSPHIRCASLLLVPKMLGKEGRLFVLGYALAAIYVGPVANLRHNLNNVIASLGCTVELQINNTRAAWRISTAPLRAMFKDLLSSKELLRAETRNISATFEDLDAQVNSETGYTPEDTMDSGETAQGREARQAPASRLHLSTQKMYELKTKLRCSYVVNQAILSCRRWFDRKHEQCMKHIWVPLLTHLLCLPMKFKFFCGIAKVMEVWCRNRIPVEGNFGQTYDSLNQSIRGLDGEFSANIDFKEEKQAGVLGLNTSWERVSTEVRDYVYRQEARLEWALGLLHVLLSCTFLLVLHASFSYMDSYNHDIRFDNIYISTYFCQIDDRRKKLGKRTLLPLRKAEEKTVIFPCKPTIQASEMSNVVRELLETLPILLLLVVLCGLDWALYSIFDTIRHHSFLQYSFRSSHKLEVKVGGDSMLARLLRKTIGALNTSSETVMESNNMPCLPQPVGLDARAYWRAAVPIGLLVCLCLLQAFGYRLRRVIAAFYFPKREKKRILFLYNDLLKKRAAFTKLRRAAILRRERQQKAPRHPLADILHRGCPLLRRWLCRRCVVCQAPETPESYVCRTLDCEAVYCWSCWDDMRQRCPVCTPREELSSSAFSDSNDDTAYAG